MNPELLVRELRDFRLDRRRQATLFEESSDGGGARGATTAPEQGTLDFGGRSIPLITNEFWSRRQRQSHSLHELSYRACFKGELPRFFIERLTKPGDVVLDPFMGRGTTCLEAALLGRIPFGNDVNPLSRVLLEPRLRPPSLEAIRERLDSIGLERVFEEARSGRHQSRSVDENLEVFFHPGTLAQLRVLQERLVHDGADPIDHWIRMVATNRLTGHSPGFFSVRTMPPNQAVRVESQRRLNDKHGLEPPLRDVREIIQRKSASLLRDHDSKTESLLDGVRDRARFLTKDARDLRGVDDRSVRLVVTSPPFIDIVDYAGDNWLRCWFNGIDAEQASESITTPRKIEAWQEFVTDVFRELERCLVPGGWIVFEVGEVRNGTIRLEEHVVPAAIDAGLDVVAIAVHSQEFTKTANCWGVANNSKGTNSNRLVILRRGT
ncbi:MAG: site-specific DNA-methyltransferase [Planctomycetes bacterium]|nr:site-specific DNA-methyltransferase [Planctomycetota bacterium]MCB9919251.1 site-specific DNA-methyltransferase [Planctomycetota bacterium]